MSKLKHKSSLSSEANCSSSLFKSNPNFNLPVFSFKDENSNNDTNQIWSLLSKQILTPFAPKFKLYDYQKFLPTKNAGGNHASIDMGLNSPLQRASNKNRLSNILPGNKEKTAEELASRFKKSSVRFNLKSVSPSNRKLAKLLRKNELVADTEKITNRTRDEQTNSRPFRFLSSNNIDFPGIENENAERPRKLSMVELPIERLLDDADENIASGSMLIDDRSEKDNLSVSNARPKSLIMDTELSLIRRTRFYTTKKKESPSLVIQEKPSDINTDTFPIRRKSCTCSECGVSKKLAKTNTIFLTEDLDILKGKPNKRRLNRANEGKKPNLMALLGKNFKNLRNNTSLSDCSDRGGRKKVARKMFQIFQMNRVLRQFSSRPLTHSLITLPNVGSISKLEETEVPPANLWQKLKDSRRTSPGKESSGKMEVLSTERDKHNMKSQRAQEGCASGSGLATTNNDSMSNSRLTSPINRTKVYENKTIAEEKELLQSSHKKIVTNGVSLNELNEDFGNTESKTTLSNQRQSVILRSITKENQTPNKNRVDHLDPHILNEKLEAQKLGNRRVLKSREATSPSTDHFEIVNSQRILSSKMGMFTTQTNFENFFRKKPATDNELERQVREVILKTRKHIDLPNNENISRDNYNPKWFASPKEARLPSLEKRMTDTYCRKSNNDAVKTEMKCRSRNPVKQRNLATNESAASSTQLNNSNRKLASRVVSDKRTNISLNANDPLRWDKRELTININTRHDLSQRISKFDSKRGLVELANPRALK